MFVVYHTLLVSYCVYLVSCTIGNCFGLLVWDISWHTLKYMTDSYNIQVQGCLLWNQYGIYSLTIYLCKVIYHNLLGCTGTRIFLQMNYRKWHYTVKWGAFEEFLHSHVDTGSHAILSRNKSWLQFSSPIQSALNCFLGKMCSILLWDLVQFCLFVEVVLTCPSKNLNWYLFTAIKLKGQFL